MRRRLIIITVLLVALVGTAYIVSSPNDKGVKTTTVYAAKESITPGTKFDGKLVEKKEVLKAEDWMITDLEEIKGLNSSELIEAGRYLDKSNFSEDAPTVFGANEGEYSIRVRAENVNGGRVEPGDIVRVFYVAKPQGGAEVVQPAGIKVVSDVLVLSVRTQYAKDVKDNKDNDLNNVPAAVTLKVSEEQGLALAGYQESGTLSVFVVRKGGTVTSE